MKYYMFDISTGKCHFGRFVMVLLVHVMKAVRESVCDFEICVTKEFCHVSY
jgi:hypothetical protein